MSHQNFLLQSDGDPPSFTAEGVIKTILEMDEILSEESASPEQRTIVESHLNSDETQPQEENDQTEEISENSSVGTIQAGPEESINYPETSTNNEEIPKMDETVADNILVDSCLLPFTKLDNPFVANYSLSVSEQILSSSRNSVTAKDNAKDSSSTPTEHSIIEMDNNPPSSGRNVNVASTTPSENLSTRDRNRYESDSTPSPLAISNPRRPSSAPSTVRNTSYLHNHTNQNSIAPDMQSNIRRRSVTGNEDVNGENSTSPPTPTAPKEEYKGWNELAQLIPGVTQAMATDSPMWLRVVYAFVVVFYVVGICVLITLGVKKTMTHSLTVTMETEEISTAHIPFPAITVGTQGGFHGDMMDDIKGLKWYLNHMDNVEDPNSQLPASAGALVVYDQICDHNTTYAGKVGIKNAQNTDLSNLTQAARIKLIDNVNEYQTQFVAEAIGEVMFQCEDLLVDCEWNGENRKCSDIFKSTFTEYGSTCTFNGIPDEAAKTHKTLQTLLGHQHRPDVVAAWEKVDMDTDSKLISDRARQRYEAGEVLQLPWRQNVPGQTSGLSFILIQKAGAIPCARTAGAGFRIAVHHPTEEAQLLRFGTPIPYEQEVFVEITPDITLADDDIRSISASRRGCNFATGDLSLKYFKKYTQKNCFAECISDKIDLIIGCSLVTSPGKPGRRLCNPAQMPRAREEFQKMYKYGLDTACPHCLPNCNDFRYKIKTSSTAIDPAILETFYRDWNLTDAKIAIVHPHIGDDATRPYRRSARYSWFELLGLVGGTVSLAGVGLVDVVDILVTLRKLERPTPKLREWVRKLIMVTRKEE